MQYINQDAGGLHYLPRAVGLEVFSHPALPGLRLILRLINADTDYKGGFRAGREHIGNDGLLSVLRARRAEPSDSVHRLPKLNLELLDPRNWRLPRPGARENAAPSESAPSAAPRRRGKPERRPPDTTAAPAPSASPEPAPRGHGGAAFAGRRRGRRNKTG
jgi:hypothetical protein